MWRSAGFGAFVLTPTQIAIGRLQGRLLAELKLSGRKLMLFNVAYSTLFGIPATVVVFCFVVPSRCLPRGQSQVR